MRKLKDNFEEDGRLADRLRRCSRASWRPARLRPWPNRPSRLADPVHPGDAAVAYPGAETSTSVESGFRLSNEVITATITGGANPNISGVTAHGVANDFSLRNLFALRLADGTITPSNSIAGATTAVDIAAHAYSIRLAARHPGRAVRTVYTRRQP